MPPKDDAAAAAKQQNAADAAAVKQAGEDAAAKQKEADEAAAQRKREDDAELERMQREEDERNADEQRKEGETKRADDRKSEDDGKHPEHAGLVDHMVNNTGCSREYAEESVKAALASRNEKSAAVIEGIKHAQGAPGAVLAGDGIPPYSPQRSGPDGRPLLAGAPDVEGPGVPTLAGTERTLESLRQGDEELVAFKVPRAFRLTLQDYSHVNVPAGFVRIPKHLADHAWLRQNGAVPE